MRREHYPQRDRHYGVWHRAKSIARYLADSDANSLTMRDLDSWRSLTPAQWARALVQIRGWQLRRFEVQQAANDERF